MFKIDIRVLVYVIVWCVVFFGYTAPYQDWRPFVDDYGVLHCGEDLTKNNPIKFYITTSMQHIHYPSNYDGGTKPSFFSVMYRPLALMLHSLEKNIFSGCSMQYHFWLVIALHAFASLLILYIFSLFFPLLYSVLGVLLFAFYPCLGWVSRLAALSYVVSLNFLLLAIIFIYHGIVDNRRWFVIPATLLFLCTAFMQETTLAFPGFVLLVIPMLISHSRRLPIFCKNVVVEVAWWVFPLGCAALCYLGARLWLYPIDWLAERPYFSPFAHIKARFFDFVTIVVDSLGLTWIPAGNWLRKGSAVVAVMSGLFWLWYYSPRKLEMLVLVSGFLVMIWASILMSHQSRYMYCAIPLIISVAMVGVYSFVYSSAVRRLVVRSSAVIALFFIAAGCFSTHRQISACDKAARVHDDAMRKFFGSEIDFPVCFVGVPMEWFPFDTAAQEVWLYRKNIPVYHDWLMNVRCYDCPTLSDLGELPRGDLLDIRISGRKVRIKTIDHEHAWILYKTPFGEHLPCTMGKFTPIEISGNKVFEAEIEIDENWYSEDLVFVTFDFEKQELVEVQREKSS